MCKYYWFLGLFLGIISCDIDYEDNKRLLITGTVLDENTEPVPNVPIEVFVSFSRIFGSSGKEILGEGKSNADGTFKLITLSPLGNNTIIAEINEQFQEGFKQQYATFSLFGIETIEARDAAIRLNNLRLERLVNTSFVLSRSANMMDTIYYNLKTNTIQKRLFIDASLAPEEFFTFFSPTDTLFPDQNESNVELTNILAKDTLELEYRLSSNSNTEAFVQKLVYNPETDSYVFEL